MKTTVSYIKVLKYIARYTLLLIASLLLVFSVVSGSEDYGGGLTGLLKNSPNAIPWLVLILLIFIAWKHELLGGTLIFLCGLWFVYFFNFSGPNFWWITFFLTALIPIMGLVFVLSWYLNKRQKENS